MTVVTVLAFSSLMLASIVERMLTFRLARILRDRHHSIWVSHVGPGWLSGETGLRAPVRFVRTDTFRRLAESDARLSSAGSSVAKAHRVVLMAAAVVTLLTVYFLVRSVADA
jgi:hypothetical protein